MDIVIGIGEFAVSNNLNDVIKTYSLGSCVALTVYCPRKKVLGMVHIALPNSDIDMRAGKERPGHFADTAIPMILDIFSTKYGCKKNDLVIKMYGGCNSLFEEDIFKIGKRNTDTIVNILNENSVNLYEADTGGYVSRTVFADVETGSTKLFRVPF